MVGKKLYFELTTITKSNPETAFLQFYVNTNMAKEFIMQCFASLRSEREPFTHVLCKSALSITPTRSCTIKE